MDIPGVGIVVVGGRFRDSPQTMTSRYAEMLVEDSNAASGWRWIKLNQMLQERYRPGVACFKGCVVVVGGDKGLSVECLPLTSIDQANGQWTLLHGFNTDHFNGLGAKRAQARQKIRSNPPFFYDGSQAYSAPSKVPSLVTFNGRLIVLRKFLVQIP